MKWVLACPELDVPPLNNFIHYWAKQLDLHPLVIKHLFIHGINNEEKIFQFLYPSINELHDPFQLNDMKKAVIRIIKALQNKERILIFGDYDVDGITASSILHKGLRFFGAEVEVRLPLRSEGYGLSPQIIEQIPPAVSLVITVDNGSSAHPAMIAAKQRGLDVIVTDHHEIIGHFPDCHAFINPKRSDSTYPFSSLCGAGVALKLVQALLLAAQRAWDKHIWDYIELAALGTIADMMPLIDENRILCSLGLMKMNSCPHPSVRALFQQLNLSNVDSTVIGFQIAPIFNSCGRIGDPNEAVQLLINEKTDAAELSTFISRNQKRKDLTSLQFEMAEEQIMANRTLTQKVIAVHGDFHDGILGLLASRIAEKYQKPAVVISYSGVGSARSVQGTNYSIIDLLTRSSSFLKKFGGHQTAAGFSIQTDAKVIYEFLSSLSELTKDEPELESKKEYLSHVLFSDFPFGLLSDFFSLEPFGLGNPKPVFCSQPSPLNNIRNFGSDHRHLEIQANSRKGVGFNLGHYAGDFRRKKPHFLYSIHSFHQKSFRIEDVQPHV
ncbi:single-stranded-DNA-specific exonuclease RecJ [Brevibacillus sp. 179-C9.3 HS]|uniref:single-stranded-DNA-specific exonuclease RecJ n=1 Tax=unclassified Brevibacillus TaxID=2684853 RepID=UPI0039A22604